MPTGFDSIEAFKKRIQRLNIELEKKPIPKALEEFITKEDLKKIYEAILNNDKKVFQEHLHQLKPNESIRIRKVKSNLPRTFSIFRKNDGEFCLILETKSKLAIGKNPNPTKFEGAFKRGKHAWRIDTKPPRKFASLVAPISADQTKESVLSEIALSQRMQNKKVASMHFGSLYRTGKNELAQNIYSESAIGSLQTLMDNGTYFRWSNEQKQKIQLDILEGLQHFHINGMVHQDIKPDNILIYKEPDGTYSAKLSDFGLTHNTDAQTEALATLGYESPEISHHHINGNGNSKKYFSDIRYFSLARDINKHKTQTTIFTTPHPANDVWSCGVMFFELKYNRKPNPEDYKSTLKKPENKYLLDMLNPERRKRATIEETLKTFHKARSNSRNAHPRDLMKYTSKKPRQHEALSSIPEEPPSVLQTFTDTIDASIARLNSYIEKRKKELKAHNKMILKIRSWFGFVDIGEKIGFATITKIALENAKKTLPSIDSYDSPQIDTSLVKFIFSCLQTANNNAHKKSFWSKENDGDLNQIAQIGLEAIKQHKESLKTQNSQRPPL